LDPEIEKEIRKRAQKSDKSLNRVIQEIISQVSSPGKKDDRTIAHSLRELAGGWSNKEASKFLESIRSCEQIDEEMWK